MGIRLTKIFLPLSLAIISFSSAALSEDAERQYLFGNWGGARSALEDKGLSIESIVTFDALSNLDGGLKRDEAYLGNYDLTLALDTEKAGLWKGGTLFAYFLGNWGDSPTSIVGDTQATDNIEAVETAKLYELWYEHSFNDRKYSFLVGLHDYNSEFDSLEYAGGLLNSSFGISVDISQVGPSIFSTTALAARVKFLPSENSYLQAAVYDGIPGDPNNSHGTHVILNTDDGLFYGVEGGLVGGEDAEYYKLALGGWLHTTDYEDFAGEERTSNSGFYLIGEKRIYSEQDASQGLGVFFQSGFADSSQNQIAQYFGAGLAYSGLIEGRDGDVTSFGVAHARNSDDFKDLDSSISSAETAIELNYRAELTPYLAVTPDMQYVIDPGTTDGVDNALVVGARFELAM